MSYYPSLGEAVIYFGIVMVIVGWLFPVIDWLPVVPGMRVHGKNVRK